MANINLDTLYRRKVQEASDLQAAGHVKAVTLNAKTLTVWVDGEVYWSADQAMEPRHIYHPEF